MVEHNTESMRTAFTVSVDARQARTGISAYERAMTIQTLLDEKSRPDDLVRPGTSFRCATGRAGFCAAPGRRKLRWTLARLAGLYPAGVICEIMNEDGTMARTPQLVEFAATTN